MIIFVVASGHQYTVRSLAGVGDAPRHRVATYFQLFGRRRLPVATYVFTDLDRLGAFELELAGALCRTLSEGGCRCLNNPAAVLGRHALLKRLRSEGINDFDAWRLDAGEMPTRWPVFVRREDGHDGTLTELLADAGALAGEVQRLVAAGQPLRHLLAVEYAGEPVGSGHYRKLGAFRVGPSVLSYPAEDARGWHVKPGFGVHAGLPYDDSPGEAVHGLLARCFDVASIDYGRADFGFFAGRPQIFEINTNPVLETAASEPEPKRRGAIDRFWPVFAAALARIDTPPAGSSVRIDAPLLRHRRRMQSWFSPRERYSIRS